MLLTNNDVSEFVVERVDEVPRLVLEIGSVDTTGGGLRRTTTDRLPVRAQVGAGEPILGELVLNPEWTQPADARTRVPSKYQAPEQARLQVGKDLFLRLFSAELSRSWAEAVDQARAHGGLHVVVRSAEAGVQALPWELLEEQVGSAGPLIRQPGWSIIRQYPRDPATLPTPASPVPASELRVLVMTADMTGISQDEDPAIIRDGLPGADVEVVARVTSGDFLSRLGTGGHSLVHVLASGAIDRKGEQLLVLGSTTDPQTVSASGIFDALGDRAGDLRLLVLAACDTDLLAAQLAERVPNVIGIRGAISDEGCLAFLRYLYRALGSGATIDQAVTAGRAQQVANSRSFGEEWALPVLFQSDGTPLVTPQTSSGDDPETAPDPDAESDTTLGLPERMWLAMKASNLLDLRRQWAGTPDDVVPPFVQDQIAELEAAVGPLEAR